MRKITTGYCMGPILKTAIMEKIKREGLIIVQNDDPIDWYKRTFCLRAKPKQEHFAYQTTRAPVLVGQTG